MKKVLLTFGLAGAVVFASAQLTSKKGETILPEADDWALQFDGTPILSYFGNLANGGTNSTIGAAFLGDSVFAITGKMFKDETTAMRAKIRIGFVSGSVTTETVSAADPAQMVEDKVSTSSMNVVLGGGMEMRRGNTRLQGFYGGEALLMLGSGGSSYEYGNPDVTGSPRVTETKDGSTFGFGVRGFVGAEYFIVPKIAVGAEFGWGLGLVSQGYSESTTSDGTTTTTGNSGAKWSVFGIDTDVNNNMMLGGTGNVMVTFHF